MDKLNDPQAHAERLLGAVEWQSAVSGLCRCPGAELHTSATGKKDCRVNIDGAPTIHCFHSSCASAVSDANKRLRQALGAVSWEIALPDGGVLRSGEVLGGLEDGGRSIEDRRKNLGDGRQRQEDCGRSVEDRGGTKDANRQERALIDAVRVEAERFRPELFKTFRWPYEQILRDSPLQVGERDAEDQFRTWLKLWPAHCHVWIGDVFSSGKPEHRAHFRPVADWYKLGPCMGNFTCGSSFQPGAHQRSNETLGDHRFLVVESDTLSRDEVGAVFAYLRRRLRYRLHCVIDTAGKSLHGWFDAPRSKTLENRLKAGLVAFGCDPQVFTYSQPVRVPGAFRDGKMQRLIWLKE